MAAKNKPDHLLVVAHPDDETLFFGGLLQTPKRWHVVCVTDGNADGLGLQREKDFHLACKKLGVEKSQMLKFPDIFKERLNLNELISQLKALGSYKKIFTHGILGEYGHMHHQDVSFAVHQAFNKNVFSIAYNTFPDVRVSLNQKMFKKKNDVLWNIYAGEIKRLIHFLPSHSTESFVKVSESEVSHLYGWLTKRQPLTRNKVQVYKWLVNYLEEGGGTLSTRVF